MCFNVQKKTPLDNNLNNKKEFYKVYTFLCQKKLYCHMNLSYDINFLLAS